MIRLLRSSSHGNAISVFEDSGRGLISKCSESPSGIERLQKEKAGWDWYRKDVLAYEYFSNTYARLDLNKIAGQKILYTKPFLKTAPVLERCLAHYIERWPKEQNVPVHGDLTLDNVIIDDEDAHFIDWEHFSMELHPWGFDALYLLLSALLLPLKKDQLPSKEDYTKFMELLFTLFDHGLSAELAEYPLSKYREIFQTRSCWADIIKCSPNKLFPTQYDELYVDIVDDQITRRIRHKRYDEYKKTVQKKAA